MDSIFRVRVELLDMIRHSSFALVVVAASPAEGVSTVTTTFRHPFCDVTQASFVEAVDLHAGDELQTADGSTATIAQVRTYHTTELTYDLTIDGLHTYYVDAGITPILVHNCGNQDLVDAVTAEHARITNPDSSGYQSIRQRGPVLTGVMGGQTGDIRISQNFGGLPENLHPSLGGRLGEFGGTNPYPGSSGAHGEVHGLNDLLWVRDAAGMSTEIDDSFTFYSVRLRGAANGQQIPSVVRV
jgi:hypothetical protein